MINCDNALSDFIHLLFEIRRTDIAFCPAVQADFTQVTFFGLVSLDNLIYVCLSIDIKSVFNRGFVVSL